MIYPAVGTDKNARKWNELTDAPFVDSKIVADPFFLEITENTLNGPADSQDIVRSAPGILMPGGVAINTDAFVRIESP